MPASGGAPADARLLLACSSPPSSTPDAASSPASARCEAPPVRPLLLRVLGSPPRASASSAASPSETPDGASLPGRLCTTAPRTMPPSQRAVWYRPLAPALAPAHTAPTIGEVPARCARVAGLASALGRRRSLSASRCWPRGSSRDRRPGVGQGWELLEVRRDRLGCGACSELCGGSASPAPAASCCVRWLQLPALRPAAGRPHPSSVVSGSSRSAPGMTGGSTSASSNSRGLAPAGALGAAAVLAAPAADTPGISAGSDDACVAMWCAREATQLAGLSSGLTPVPAQLGSWRSMPVHAPACQRRVPRSSAMRRGG